MKKLLFSAVLLSASIVHSQIFSENFEGTGLPAGWTKTQNTPSAGWEFGANLSSQYWVIPAHTKYAASNDDAHDNSTTNANDASADRLITPAIDLTTITSAALKFDAYYSGIYESVATVEVSVNGGAWQTILTLDPLESGWQDGVIANLSPYVGQANVKLAFKHDDSGLWADGFAIDNVIIYTPPANEARLNSVVVNRFGLINTNNNLICNVTNLGSTPISSITIDWNDGTSHSQNISVSIAPFTSMDIIHPTPVSYSMAVEKLLNVNITLVNGSQDTDLNNNSGSAKFNALSQPSPKKVVIEEGTGTWCQWCPRGAVAMESMYQNHPDDFIGIAVHNQDPMTVAAYNAGVALNGYPGCNVDRALLDQDVNETDFESYYQERIGLPVPASLALNITGATSKTISVSATFRTVFSQANYRLGVIIIEDDVTGTGAGYNQANAYAGGAFGPMGGFESLPNPVPAAQMVYDHVGRALLGGYSGQANSVPVSITDGQVISYDFTYNVPATSNSAKMYAVALLIDNATGEIVNANKQSISGANVNELANMELIIYPNPASSEVNVSFEATNNDYAVSLMDLQGRVIAAKNMTNLNGTQVVSFSTENVAKGSYIVTVTVDGLTTTKNVVIK